MAPKYEPQNPIQSLLPSILGHGIQYEDTQNATTIGLIGQSPPASLSPGS